MTQPLANKHRILVLKHDLVVFHVECFTFAQHWTIVRVPRCFQVKVC